MSAAEKQSAAPAAQQGKRNRLGRGLAALIGDAAAEEGLYEAPPPDSDLPIEMIRANPNNPRRIFHEADLEELALSIQGQGLIQPLIVRPLEGFEGQYEIVAGERRWRAAQLARLHKVPVVVRHLTDSEALEIAIIENVQRTDLNPVEEAEGYRRLMDDFSYTQEQLSKVIGKSRSHVANTLRLISLPDKVKQYLADGLLTAGHARALITAENPVSLATEIVQKGLSVRGAEALAKRGEAGAGDGSAGAPKKPAAPSPKDADTLALEKDLADALGLAVRIDHRGQAGGQGGEVKIAYRTLEQLDEVCRRLLNRNSGD
ncbi:Chromosome (plasmid) partitioning protein ParB [hydrothermal vent metagenome]|uniref:Chromosome (Plasmid) partitioning protein ParB n=1 Tax=hydrothermal vent metagenome TaxID=652676 RepID=A0A3B0TQD2_9ZZZZ